MKFLNNKSNTALYIWFTGEFWFENSKYHRLNRPAIIYHDGLREWCQNGKYHRTDGPTRIHSDGSEEWWENGRGIK